MIERVECLENSKVNLLTKATHFGKLREEKHAIGTTPTHDACSV